MLLHGVKAAFVADSSIDCIRTLVPILGHRPASTKVLTSTDYQQLVLVINIQRSCTPRI